MRGATARRWRRSRSPSTRATRPDRRRRRVAPRRRAVVLLRAARPRRRRAGGAGRGPRDRGARARPLQARRGALARAGRRTRRATRPTAPAAAARWRSAASRSRPTAAPTPHWAGFAAASLLVPEVALRAPRRRRPPHADRAGHARRHGRRPARAARAPRRRAARRLPLPLLDPDPAGRYRVVSATPPEHYEEAVARAVERIAAGDLEKIVLAREVQVHAPADHDPAAVLGVLREAFPACHLFCAGRGDAAFVAASPELLIRRDGLRAATLGARRLDAPQRRPGGRRPPRRAAAAVAPRTARSRRSSCAASRARCGPHARVGHRARRARARPGRQHPAPGHADPRAAAPHRSARSSWPGCCTRRRRSAASRWPRPRPLIPALEGLDRGWYAGPVGWTDLDEDGEFCVALRCALLRGPVARCYAGVGVVRDSDPAAELAETEVKLQALLPVLAG